MFRYHKGVWIYYYYYYYYYYYWLIDWLIDWLIVHTLCDIGLSPTYEGILCYVYRTDKTLWGRKPLAGYTATARRRNNNAETMYQKRAYSFYPARDARVNSYCVPVLFLCNASSLLCSSLMISYTTMFRSPIAKIRCTRGVRDCNAEAVLFRSMIAIHLARKYMWKRGAYDEKVECGCNK